jgi:hypothetical protein
MNTSAEYVTKKHECARCKAIYKPIKEIGRFNCRQHKGIINIQGYYTCCKVFAHGATCNQEFYDLPMGLTQDELGCQRCCHKSNIEADCYKPYTKDNSIIAFPKNVANIYKDQFKIEHATIVSNNPDFDNLYYIVSLVDPPQL